MKVSELKKLIKPLIKECLNEVLAEQYLKTLAESRATISRASTIGDDEPAPCIKPALKPSVKKASKPGKIAQLMREYSATHGFEEEPVAAVPEDPQAIRQKLREQLKDDDMAYLYSDALEHMPKPGSAGVSESVMQKMGLYETDYSRYVANTKVPNNQ